MQRKRKIGLALTSTVLSMSLLAAGCSSGGKSATPSASPSVTATSAAKEPPMEITFSFQWDHPKDDNSYVQKYLEEKFNIKIKNMRINQESFNTKIAAGEIPDIFPGYPVESDMVNWARTGVIANISADEIKKYMPKYSKMVNETDARAWDIAYFNGKNWGVPRVWPNGAYGFVPTYNGTWLKAVGINELPKTLAELEDMLVKLRNNDPDGNGKKDTYGMTTRGKDARPQYFNSIFSAYGINPYQFMLDKDGKVTWGAITEEARQALKLINKWYKADLIDPEFLTDSNAQIGQKWDSKKIGYKDNYLYHSLYGSDKGDKEKGIETVFGKPLVGPNGGEMKTFSYGALQVPLLLGKQLEKDEKKRIKVLQILEEIATNDEVYLTTAFGQKDVTYELKDGVATYKDTPEKHREIGLGGFYNPFIEKSALTWKFHMPADKVAFKDKLTGGVKTITDLLGPTSLESKGKFNATLTSLQDQYYSKAVIGQADLDKGFDEFKAAWLKGGGQEILDEATKVYQERKNKK